MHERHLKKYTPFIWSNESQTSFKFFKKQLLSPTIIKPQDFEKSFILTTDTSEFALEQYFHKKT